MRNSWGRRGFRPKKYNNQPIKYDGFTFSSETEYNRYLLLKDRVHDGEITDLVVHPAFRLEIDGVEIFERPFHPDFKFRLVDCPKPTRCYIERDAFLRQPPVPDLSDVGRSFCNPHWCGHCCVCEDTKGYMDPSDLATRMFYVQRQLMQAIYGIDVKIVQTILVQRRQEKAQANKKEKRRLQQLALKMENEPNDRRRGQSRPA